MSTTNADRVYGVTCRLINLRRCVSTLPIAPHGVVFRQYETYGGNHGLAVEIEQCDEEQDGDDQFWDYDDELQPMLTGSKLAEDVAVILRNVKGVLSVDVDGANFTVLIEPDPAPKKARAPRKGKRHAVN